MAVVISFQFNLKQNETRESQTPFVEYGWMELGAKIPVEVARRFSQDLANGSLAIESTHHAMLAWHDYYFPHLTKDIK